MSELVAGRTTRWRRSEFFPADGTGGPEFPDNPNSSDIHDGFARFWDGRGPDASTLAVAYSSTVRTAAGLRYGATVVDGTVLVTVIDS